MKSRMDRVRRGKGDQAVHVWGPDHERCALACEVAGAPVVRLESGGFFTELDTDVGQLLSSDRFNVQNESLSWSVIEWREQGRALFRNVVVDLEEEEYSADPSWGSQDLESSYEAALSAVAKETAQRLKSATADPASPPFSEHSAMPGPGTERACCSKRPISPNISPVKSGKTAFALWAPLSSPTPPSSWRIRSMVFTEVLVLLPSSLPQQPSLFCSDTIVATEMTMPCTWPHILSTAWP